MSTNTEKLNYTEETCEGCGKHCLLSDLRCSKGRRLNGLPEIEGEEHGHHDKHGDYEHGGEHRHKGEREAHGHGERFAHGDHGEFGHHNEHGHRGCHGWRKHKGEEHRGEREGGRIPFDIDAEGTKGLYARLRECGHYLYHRQGAYVGQERVLKDLSENGGMMSQRELTERLHLQRASVSEILGKLEMRQLVVREQSLSDRRSQDIRLTAEGIRAAEEIAGRQKTEYDELFEDIAEEEQKTLYELLGKLLEKWRRR